MKLKSLLVFVFLTIMVSIGVHAQLQDGTLKGKVAEDGSGEALPFVPVQISNGNTKKVVETDLDGNYRFSQLDPGKYTITVKFSGYRPQQITEIDVIGGKTNVLEITLVKTVKEVKEVDVIVFKKPLFEIDQSVVSNTIDQKQLAKAPVKGLDALATTSSGANSNKTGGISIRGGRPNATVYFIDGVKVLGSGLNLAQGGIEQMQVITGGIPAEYGDATGGIISVTTRGPAQKFSGGLDAQTSKKLDPFNYNSFEGNLSGPIYKKKYKDRLGKDSTERSVLGFFVSSILNYSLDPSPTNVEMYQANEATQNRLNETPLTRYADANSPLGYVFLPSANYVDKSQMERVYIRNNTPRLNYTVTGKVDYSPIPNLNITVGGSIFRQERNDYVRQYQMFNSENNPLTTNENARVYARIRQSFPSKDPNATVKNVSYSLQFDFQNDYSETKDKNFKDNYFQYGYIGKFDNYKSAQYSRDKKYYRDSNGVGYIYNANYFRGNFTDSIKFTKGGFNPVGENYTKEIIDFNDGKVFSLNSIVQNNGLINGTAPSIVNSLWSNTGTKYTQFAKNNTTQIGINFQSSIALKKHDIKFGFQYDQRNSRGYSVQASTLYTLGRQLVNRQILLDTANPIFKRDADGRPIDTVDFNFTTGKGQTIFDQNLRQSLINSGYTDEKGNKINATSSLNIDRLSPDQLKLSLFSADELLNQGNSYVNYYGYDYTGKVQSGKTSVNEFLNDTLKRKIGGYQPIYIAGFIQDKFEFKDITFNVGLRVDRFDANQLVLKDQYSVYPVRTAGEIDGNKTFSGTTYRKPSNIGSDWVPYVNDPINPTTSPIGYRDPSTNKWYDAKGIQVSDVASLAALNSGQLFPYLANGATRENYKRPVVSSFQDYSPQVNFMPRVSFSFPINKTAVFFANYNVLTQRPRNGQFATFDDYYYLQQRSTGIVSNNALKPERRTNYEVGFKQKVGTTSALTIQAFYGEIKDMIQLQKVLYAWPISYTTFANIDFGTVKGLTLIYDYRRIKESGIELSANYTLQFADGTGSDAGTQQNIVALGQPNLRTPLPLDYDVRHAINITADYRFGHGINYAGPTSGSKFLDGLYKGLMDNSGFFFIIQAKSGTPYSRQGNVTQDVAVGIANRSTLEGDANSARIPWNYKIDFTFDKNISIQGKSIKDAVPGNVIGRKGGMDINIYLSVQNILNVKNIFSVYKYTGSATDDGYLSSALGQQTLNSLIDQSTRQAFQDQYSVKLNDPSYFGSPRIVRIGARVNF